MPLVDLGKANKWVSALKTSAHLPVEATAQSPVSIYEEIDSCKQQHHGHWVIKETEHKDGVDPIGCTAHKEEHIGRNLEEKKEGDLIICEINY